jgi:formylglycine-generating enzyme required for sulfatase activity
MIAALVALVNLAQAAPPLPDMAALGPGTFTMGSAVGEPDETPPRAIDVGAFKLARREVTVAEFRRFVEATGHEPPAGCNRYTEGKLTADPNLSWRNPGFQQSDDHPVACVGWNDAQAYIAWLNRETGDTYRLPTEAEWEFAAKAGGEASNPWRSPADACAMANAMDRTAAAASDLKMIFGDPTKYAGNDEQVFPCTDGYLYTAPAGTFAPNAWGLHDIIGNVWEFVQDCASDSLAERPRDASAVERPGCPRRGIRGAGWNIGPKFARIGNRSDMAPDGRNWGIGFRLAHD